MSYARFPESYKYLVLTCHKSTSCIVPPAKRSVIALMQNIQRLRIEFDSSKMVVFFKDPFGNHMINQHLRTIAVPCDMLVILRIHGLFSPRLVARQIREKKSSLAPICSKYIIPGDLNRCPPEIQRTCTGASNVHPATKMT